MRKLRRPREIPWHLRLLGDRWTDYYYENYDISWGVAIDLGDAAQGLVSFNDDDLDFVADNWQGSQRATEREIERILEEREEEEEREREEKEERRRREREEEEEREREEEEERERREREEEERKRQETETTTQPTSGTSLQKLSTPRNVPGHLRLLGDKWTEYFYANYNVSWGDAVDLGDAAQGLVGFNDNDLDFVADSWQGSQKATEREIERVLEERKVEDERKRQESTTTTQPTTTQSTTTQPTSGTGLQKLETPRPQTLWSKIFNWDDFGRYFYENYDVSAGDARDLGDSAEDLGYSSIDYKSLDRIAENWQGNQKDTTNYIKQQDWYEKPIDEGKGVLGDLAGWENIPKGSQQYLKDKDWTSAEAEKAIRYYLTSDLNTNKLNPTQIATFIGENVDPKDWKNSKSDENFKKFNLQKHLVPGVGESFGDIFRRAYEAGYTEDEIAEATNEESGGNIDAKRIRDEINNVNNANNLFRNRVLDEVSASRKETLDKLFKHYEEDREEGKEFRERLEDDRRSALEKAEEEEERRREFEEQFLDEHEAEREHYKQYYRTGVKQFRKYRDITDDYISQRDDLIADIKSAPSTVEEQARQNYERSLANQAALASSLPTRMGGSASKRLSDLARTHNAQISQQTVVARMQEKLQRDALLGDLLGAQANANMQQQNLALGARSSSLAALQESNQALAVKGAMAQRSLGAQGLNTGSAGTMGGQYGGSLAGSISGSQGFAGVASNILSQQSALDLQLRQIEEQRKAQWLGLAGGIIETGGTILGGLLGGTAGGLAGNVAGKIANQFLGSQTQDNRDFSNYA